MTTSSPYRGLALGLALLAVPAAAHIGRPDGAAVVDRVRAASGIPTLLADASTGQMRIGLTVVAAEPVEARLPDPASLGYPASPNAVLCHSDDHGYRECLTPFHGRVVLSREVSATRCVENRNWGWRDGAVWVDQGCGAVFVRIGAI
jgi:hypothetical protein